MLMQLLQPQDDLRKHFSGFIKREHHLFVDFCLIIDKVSQITVLKYQVDVVFVFLDIIQFDSVRRVHLFHALDLPIQVVSHILLLSLEFAHSYDFKGVFVSFLVFNEMNVTISSFSQPLFTYVLIQVHDCELCIYSLRSYQ